MFLQLAHIALALLSPSATSCSIFQRRTITCTASASNVLILDHYNYNHKCGDHELLKAFFFDVLGLTVDLRKADNIDAGKGTIWANMAAHQFHLAEGKPDAQVLDGCLTLGYSSLDGVRERLKAGDSRHQRLLATSAFSWTELADGSLELTDPWGSPFRLVEGAEDDARSKQKNGGGAEARCLLDLTLHLPAATTRAQLAGIGRFYSDILGCHVASLDEASVVIQMGGPARSNGSPRQTLSFVKTERQDVRHEDLGVDADGQPLNRGAHISMYLQDMRGAYRKADALGLCYVNHRFKRRAYTEAEAVEQCMFRMLDVVDPEDAAAGPILRLEHEVRSATKADGSKYKSCPLEAAALVSAAA